MGSTNPTPLVLTIIGINVVVFFLERFGNDRYVIDKYALQPFAVHYQHQYYRAFTAMFLHANFQHILFNMIALLIVGPAVEVLLGKARFLVLYLLAGFAGSVASYLLSPANILGLGASGAIMGVMGAYVVIGLRRRLPIAAVVALLVLNLLIGFSGSSTGGPTWAAWPWERCSPSSTTTPGPARPHHGAGPDGGVQRGGVRDSGPAAHRCCARAREPQLTSGRLW